MLSLAVTHDFDSGYYRVFTLQIVMTKPTVLLTGAANGIGRATATALIESGYSVILTDIDLETLSQRFQTTGSVTLTKLDITQPNEWQAIAEAHKVDILINNAGIIIPGWTYETEIDAISAQVDINIKGMMYGTRIFGEQMVAKRAGQIINIASLGALAPVPGIGVYAATKHAVRGFSLTAALEMREYGVSVTAICPDLVQTHMFDVQLERDEAAITFSGAKNPLTPTQIADLILQTIGSAALEVGIPRGRYWTAKLAGLFPATMPLAFKLFTAKGRHQMRRLREGN